MSTLKVNAITDLSDSPKYQPLLLTAQTATGTAVDFTGIPSWVKRITVMYDGLSTNGTSTYHLQIGGTGGIENTGYLSSSVAATTGSTAGLSSTIGFMISNSVAAASNYRGLHTLCNISGNTWVLSGHHTAGSTNTSMHCGSKTLSDTLTQVRITTFNGTDTFDAGTINLMLE